MLLDGAAGQGDAELGSRSRRETARVQRGIID